MTQTFTGPDGEDYDFPDNMSEGDIKGVFQKKFGGPTAPQVPPSSAGTPPTPAGALPAGSSAGGTPAGTNQPTPPSATATDSGAWLPQSRAELMNRLSAPLQGAGQAVHDYDRSIVDALSMGYADRAGAYLTGTPLKQWQDETSKARENLGYMDYPAQAIGYALNPIARVGGMGAGLLEKGGALAAEGGLASIGSQTGHTGTFDPTTAAANAATNVGLGAVMKGASKLAGNIKPYLPTSEQLHSAADSMWDNAKSLFTRNEMSSLSNKVQTGFNNTGRPYSQAVPSLMDDIAKKVQPGGADARTVIDLQNQAKALKGDDATYGNMIANHIEDTINANPKGPAIQQARAADAFANEYDKIKANPPSGPGQWFLNQVGSHAFRLGREIPFIGGLGLAEGAHQMGYTPLAHSLYALSTGVPAIGYAAEKGSALLQQRAIEQAQRALTGTTGTPRLGTDAQDAFRNLIFGGIPTSTQ